VGGASDVKKSFLKVGADPATEPPLPREITLVPVDEEGRELVVD